jgi:hypothetical protein
MRTFAQELFYRGFSIVADSGFATSDGVITTRPRIENEDMKQYRQQVTQCRTSSEHGNAMVKANFGRLFMTLPICDEKRRLILDNIFRLHNYRVMNSKRNEIAKTYNFEDVDEEEEEEEE